MAALYYILLFLKCLIGITLSDPNVFDVTLFNEAELAGNLFELASTKGVAIIAEARFADFKLIEDELERYRDEIGQNPIILYTGLGLKYIETNAVQKSVQHIFNAYMMDNNQEVSLVKIMYEIEVAEYGLEDITINTRNVYTQNSFFKNSSPFINDYFFERIIQSQLARDKKSGIKLSATWKKVICYRSIYSMRKWRVMKDLCDQKIQPQQQAQQQAQQQKYGYLSFTKGTQIANSNLYIVDRWEYFRGDRSEKKRNVKCFVDIYGLTIFDKYTNDDIPLIHPSKIMSYSFSSFNLYGQFKFYHFIHLQGNQVIAVNFNEGTEEIVELDFDSTKHYFVGLKKPTTNTIPVDHDLKLQALTWKSYMPKQMPKVEDFKKQIVTIPHSPTPITHYRSPQLLNGDCVMRSVNSLLNGPFYSQKDMVKIAKKVYNAEEADAYQKTGGWFPKKHPYYNKEGFIVSKAIWKSKKKPSKSGKKRPSIKILWPGSFTPIIGYGAFHDNVADEALKMKGAEEYLLPTDRDHIPALYFLDTAGLLGIRFCYGIYGSTETHSIAIVYDAARDEYLWMQSWFHKTPFRITKQKLVGILERWAYGELDYNQETINKATFAGFRQHSTPGQSYMKIFVVRVTDKNLYEDEIEKLATKLKGKRIIQSAVNYEEYTPPIKIKKEAELESESSQSSQSQSYQPNPMSVDEDLEQEYSDLLDRLFEWYETKENKPNGNGVPRSKEAVRDKMNAFIGMKLSDRLQQFQTVKEIYDEYRMENKIDNQMDIEEEEAVKQVHAMINYINQYYDNDDYKYDDDDVYGEYMVNNNIYFILLLLLLLMTCLVAIGWSLYALCLYIIGVIIGYYCDYIKTQIIKENEIDQSIDDHV